MTASVRTLLSLSAAKALADLSEMDDPARMIAQLEPRGQELLLAQAVKEQKRLRRVEDTHEAFLRRISKMQAADRFVHLSMDHDCGLPQQVVEGAADNRDDEDKPSYDKALSYRQTWSYAISDLDLDTHPLRNLDWITVSHRSLGLNRKSGKVEKFPEGAYKYIFDEDHD
jgi:hypothetical protein